MGVARNDFTQRARLQSQLRCGLANTLHLEAFSLERREHRPQQAVVAASGGRQDVREVSERAEVRHQGRKVRAPNHAGKAHALALLAVKDPDASAELRQADVITRMQAESGVGHALKAQDVDGPALTPTAVRDLDRQSPCPGDQAELGAWHVSPWAGRVAGWRPRG